MQDRDNLLSRRTQRASSDAASVAKYHMQSPQAFLLSFLQYCGKCQGKVWEGGCGRRVWEGGCGRVGLGCDSGCEAEVYVLQHQPATL